MAIYKWVGNTGHLQTKYDWNTVTNWRVRSFVNGEWKWVSTSNAPGVGDTVFIGSVGPSPSITAQSPLLYGGFSGGANPVTDSATWKNATTEVGTTGNFALADFDFRLSDEGAASGVDPYYPFPYLGGGLTGEIYTWALSSDGLSATTTSLADHYKTGNLTLRTKNVNGVLFDYGGTAYYTSSNRSVSLVFAKNLSYVSPYFSTLAGPGLTGLQVDSNVRVEHNGKLKIKGGSHSFIEIIPKITNANASPISSVYNTSVKRLETYPGTFYCDSSVTAGNVVFRGGQWNKNNQMWFGGYLNMNTVLTDANSTTNGAIFGDSTLQMDAIPASVDGTKHLPCYFGDSTNQTTQIVIGAIDIKSSFDPTLPASSSESGQWKLAFVGPAKMNTIRSENSVIAADTSLDPNAKLTIGTIFLDKASLVDFSANESFSNWELGSTNGSAGGIIFRDENSTVRGSSGLRLWNTEMINGRGDTRLGVLNAGETLKVDGTPVTV